MSLHVTLYPGPETVYEPSPYGTGMNKHGRAYCTLNVDGMSFQTSRWEDMQRFVDALTVAITQAKQAEQDAALTPLDAAVS